MRSCLLPFHLNPTDLYRRMDVLRCLSQALPLFLQELKTLTLEQTRKDLSPREMLELFDSHHILIAAGLQSAISGEPVSDEDPWDITLECIASLSCMCLRAITLPETEAKAEAAVPRPRLPAAAPSFPTGLQPPTPLPEAERLSIMRTGACVLMSILPHQEAPFGEV